MDTNIIFLTGFSLLLIHPASTLSTCPAIFNRNCTCAPDPHDVYITNCTDANFKETVKLEKIPTDTQILVFVGNDFPNLPPNVFGQSADFSSLREIDLSNNKIETIDSQSFTSQVRRVQKLTLNNNKWTPQPGIDVFSNFHGLRKLYLSNAFAENDALNLIATMITTSAKSLVTIDTLDLSDNSIAMIEDDIFLCFLQNLKVLNLAKNKLKSITLSNRCTQNLASLDLSRNEITKLDETSMALLDSLPHTRVDLSLNPFNCDCHLIETVNWWKNTSADLVGVQCSRPDTLKGQFLDVIDVGVLTCSGVGLVVNLLVLVLWGLIWVL